MERKPRNHGLGSLMWA